MRKQWLRVGGVAGIASLCWLGAQAAGQADYDAQQYPQYVQYPQGPPVEPGVPAEQVTLNSDQLDQLLAPIALYPDPLLSLVFPAATYPQDITAAQQWLAATPNPTEPAIDAQSWDASVKGLVHYPTVLKMMSDQMDWTQALGAAFLNQQADVLASVQRLRGQARAAGNLQNTPDDQIVDDSGAIRIEPVTPDVIYVPQYDPNVVYTSAYPINWGVGYPIGLWDYDDFNWGGGYVVVGGGWYRGWHHPDDWDQHPPAWARDAHWDNGTRWGRAGGRPAPPRMTTAIVSHVGLDRPRGASGAARPAPAPSGREVAPRPSGNAFEPVGNRADVQRAAQRAHPAPAPPANAPRTAPPRAQPAPQAPVERAAPPPQAPPPRAAPPAQPPPQRAAPSGAFGSDSAGAARAASSRGHASGGHR